MKNACLLSILFLYFISNSIAQTTGAFTVGGTFDKFYPVTFVDGGRMSNSVSELQIVRPNVHENATARGSMMSKFSYHTTLWGHGSNFINADIVQVNNSGVNSVPFIAGWKDASIENNSLNIVVWLRGGSTTYHYSAQYSTTVTVYDGIANALPFLELNGPAHSYKTFVEPYVNSNGINNASAYFTADHNNYFAGNVGIGTATPTEKLSVNGKIRAREIKVENAIWPDYVFAKDYRLPSLQETKEHIRKKGHLPGIPSAAEVKVSGIDLGEMNAKLLKKIEELTLYLINQQKDIDTLKKQIILIGTKRKS